MDKTQTTNPQNEKSNLGLSHEMAISIGNRLKEAREQKSKTYKQIAAKIRIKESYLEAIELGNWDVLPAGINGRGFVRLYARELDVPLPEFDDFSQGKTQYQILADDYEKAIEVKHKKEKKRGSKKAKVEESSESKLIIDDVDSKISLVGKDQDKSELIEELNVGMNGVSGKEDQGERKKSALKGKMTFKRIGLIALAAGLAYGIFSFLSEDHSVHMLSQSYENFKSKFSSLFEKKEAIVAEPEQAIAPASESLNQGVVKSEPPQQPQQEQQTAQEQQITQQQQEQAAPQEQPVQQEQQVQTPQDSAQEPQQPHENEPSAPTQVEGIAKVDVLSPVEMKISADGKDVFSGIHNPGAVELSFTQKAEIVIADGSKVKLSYGGWDLGVLGTSGRKRKIILNAQSYQE